MNFLKKLIKGLIILFGLLVAVLYITDTDYLLKAVRTIYLKGHSTAFLEDYKEFDNQVIDNATPQPWPEHKAYNTIEETESIKTSKYSRMELLLM